MADELQTKRIINLTAEASPAAGDNLVVDNASTGTKRLPLANLIDNTLTDPKKMAGAAATGAAIEEVRSLFVGDIDESVKSWLDDHPEATTTVQDFSLTANKFVKGTLGYVLPQQFGAVCDGVTNDAQAIQSAIEYAMANNCAVYFPSGVYAISPQSINIDFVGGDSLVMFGDGKTSCIKRMDDSLDNKWDKLFLINNADATADSGLLYIHDLYIDSNRRNQSNATMDFTYESSADFLIYFNNASGYSLDTALFENLWFFDGVADHLDFTGSGIVHIKNIVLNKIFTSGRQGTRNDIDFPGIPMGNIFITNVVCQRIHIEYNGTPTDPQYYFITNVICEEFSCPARLGRFKVANLTVNKLFIFGCRGGLAEFTNCEFNFNSETTSRILSADNLSKITFNGCVFNMYDVETPMESGGQETNCSVLYLRKYLDVTFSNCRFDYVGAYDYTTKTLIPITSTYLSEGVDTVNSQKITLDGCSFSEKFSYALFLYGCGTILLKNLTVGTHTFALINTTHGYIDVTFENVHLFGGNSEYSLNLDAAAVDSMTLRGELKCEPQNVKFEGASGTVISRANYLMKTTVDITSPLTLDVVKALYKKSSSNYFAVFKNNEIVYKGDNRERYPQKWIHNASGSVNASGAGADKFISIGNGVGASTDRPTCYLSKGFQYYDTDLGKTICWDGTTWANLDGSALA